MDLKCAGLGNPLSVTFGDISPLQARDLGWLVRSAEMGGDRARKAGLEDPYRHQRCRFPQVGKGLSPFGASADR